MMKYCFVPQKVLSFCDECRKCLACSLSYKFLLVGLFYFVLLDLTKLKIEKKDNEQVLCH